MIKVYDQNGVEKSPEKTLVSASAVRTTAWSHTSTGNWLNIPWDADGYDPAGFHSTSSNTERLTVLAGYGGGSGVFMAGGGVVFASNVTGIRAVSIHHYNSASAFQRSYSSYDNYAVAGGNRYCASGLFWGVSDGDYFTLQAYQSSGGNLNAIDVVTGGSIWCFKVS